MTSSTKTDASSLVFDKASVGSTLFHGSFDVGLHVLLGGPGDGPSDILELACGQLRATRGRVELDGEAPFGSPGQRRRTATNNTGLHSCLRSVRRAIELVTETRGHGAERVLEVLNETGHVHLLEKRPKDLGGAELGVVQLSLALGHEHAKLVALHEPYSLAKIDPLWLSERLQKKAASAIVLVSVPSPTLPEQLAAVKIQSQTFLRHGSVLPDAPQTSGWLHSRTLSIRGEPIEPLARLLQLPETTGGEVVRGNPGLVRVDFAAGNEGFAERVCFEALRIAAEEKVHIVGLKLEGEPR